ncbi:competence type IV pilus assembly protein ComGB [Bacillaceae bacterium S4-13-58]
MPLASLMNLNFRKKPSKNLTLKQQQRLLKRLADLLEQGYPLQKALQLIKLDTEIPKEILDHIQNSLLEGDSLYDAFRHIGFNNDTLAFLYTTEVIGDLSHQLKKATTLLQEHLLLHQKYKKALSYPVLLCIVMLFLFSFLKLALFPQFILLFESFQQLENNSFSLWMSIFSFLFNSFLFLLLFSVFLYLSWTIVSNRLTVQRKITILSKIPFLWKGVKQKVTFHFTTQLGLYIEGGLTIKDSLQLLRKENNLPYVQYCTSYLYQRLLEGEQLGNVVREIKLLDSQLSIVIQHGQETRSLGKDLQNYGYFIIETIHENTLKYISWVQPLSFFLLAGSIIFIYLMILLPLFQWMQTI